MRRDRGFSLIEVIIAVGLIALFAATGAGLTLANRSLAVAAAAGEFDQLLDGARTTAREVGEGRLTFTADGDGTVATFNAVGSDGTLLPTTLPALHTQAQIAEQQTLGNPAFALVLHADGRLGGIPNAGSDEVGCPASGSFDIRISAAGGSVDRFLPCSTTLASGGPVTYTVWPPATLAPTPVAQCTDSCTPPPLPNASSPPLTCPAGTNPVGTTCVPTPAPTPTPTPTAIVTATPTPAPTPTATPTTQPTAAPPTCDLVQAGTCYRRIAGPTLETFDKEVDPNYSCDSSGMNCQWVNSVGLVTVTASDVYSIKPPIAPNDPTHRLLFVVDAVPATYSLCATFEAINEYSASPPTGIQWSEFSNGMSASNTAGIENPIQGFGQPAIYAFRNQIVHSPMPFGGVYLQTIQDLTQFSQTIDQFISAVGTPLSSPLPQTEYWDQAVSQGEYITYAPDFTDCASGYPADRVLSDQLYGLTTVSLIIEVYQAIPQ